MASRPNEYGQRLDTIEGVDDLAAKIHARVTAAVADDKAASLALVLPDVTTPDELVQIALGLKGLPGWTVKHWKLAKTPGGPMVAFGVAHDVKLATGAMVPSEALVLGPFDGFPPTRSRAPVTGFEIFVGTPPDIDSKTNAPPTKANLAHVQLGMAQAVFNRVWAKTIENRLEELGGKEDERAKAKIAFVVPTAIAKKRGCT
jgi:hypothetical protein